MKLNFKQNLSKLAMVSVLAASLGTPCIVAAQGVPTSDITSRVKLVEMLAEARLQLEEMLTANIKLDEQTVQLIEQAALLKSQLDALRDGLDLDQLNIGEDFLEGLLPEFADLREKIEAARAGNWEDLASGGTINGKPIGDFVDGIFESAGISRETVETMAKSDDPATARIGGQASTGAALSVAAEASAEDARESLERVAALTQQIPDAPNLRSAIDLNTRVTAELAIALANIWTMEAAQTVGLGAAGVTDAATLAEDEAFLTLEVEN